MSEKQFEIIDEHYVGYYQGTAFLMSNGEEEWYIWEKKEKAQELVDLLNSLSKENEQLRKELDWIKKTNKLYGYNVECDYEWYEERGKNE